MKSKFFLTILPIFALSQQKIQMDFAKDLKDPTRTVKTLSVIDVRPDTTPQNLTYKGETYIFEFPHDLNSSVQAEFDHDNKTKGTRDIVVLFEDFNVSEFDTGKKTVPRAHVRASMFEKRNGQYYYLHTVDKNVGIVDVQNAMTPKLVSAYFNRDISEALKASYTKEASSIGLNHDQLNNYYTVLSGGMPAFTNTLKDGVYDSYSSFFNQNAKEGFVLEKNKEGKIVKAKKGDEKIPEHKIYAYVENGTAYINTFSGFMPLQRNDRGYYVISNRGELEAVAPNSTYGMFGLVGGIAGAIDQNAKQNKAKKETKREIYIDPLTGAFIY